MGRLEVRLLPVLSDNYAYLLRDPASGAVAVVDPPVVEPVLEAVAGWGGRLDCILVTHHHSDHVAGIPGIKAAKPCTVIGPEADRPRVPGLDEGVRDGDVRRLGGLALHVLATPGHTANHVAFHAPEAEALFCGDTLFALGCGRILEGTAQEMWRSLERLAGLPDATAVYCGHEYTEANARFALTVEPDLPPLQERAAAIKAQRARGEPTIPTTIGAEKATNPFLRAGGAERFAELRAMKDRS